MGIPQGVDDLTPDWFAEELGWNVDSVSAEQIGIGIGVSSAVYRLTLVGDGVPATVVAKLVALDPAAAFTSQALKFYEREVQFYDKLADVAPVRAPHGHYGQVSEDGGSFVVIIEDLQGNRMIDQTEALDAGDAERIVDALADWHARFWNSTDGMCESGQAVALADPIYPTLLPGLFEEGWVKLTASSACVPDASLHEIGRGFGASVAELLQRLSTGPMTLLHGDARTDNIMFADDGTPIFMDFQILGVGSAAYDLAYFITQSIDIDAEHERALFDRWIARLEANGVPGGDLGGLWADYRTAALFCIVYPVVAARGMDIEGDPRQAALVNVMINRLVRAAVDLDLEAALP